MERLLKDILIGNRAKSTSDLPMVHAAPAYTIQQILQTGSVEPRKCDVYIGESLSYFFVGRPAYKSVGRDSQHWELPSCLILDFQVKPPKRIYPFDSGAFKKGFLPKYATMMDIENFRIDSVPDASKRYIGTFLAMQKNTSTLVH